MWLQQANASKSAACSEPSLKSKNKALTLQKLPLRIVLLCGDTSGSLGWASSSMRSSIAPLCSILPHSRGDNSSGMLCLTQLTCARTGAGVSPAPQCTGWRRQPGLSKAVLRVGGKILFVLNWKYSSEISLGLWPYIKLQSQRFPKASLSPVIAFLLMR